MVRGEFEMHKFYNVIYECSLFKSILHKATSMVSLEPRLTFEQKKQRLNLVLFGEKDTSKENIESPIKGKKLSIC